MVASMEEGNTEEGTIEVMEANMPEVIMEAVTMVEVIMEAATMVEVIMEVATMVEGGHYGGGHYGGGHYGGLGIFTDPYGYFQKFGGYGRKHGYDQSPIYETTDSYNANLQKVNSNK